MTNSPRLEERRGAAPRVLEVLAAILMAAAIGPDDARAYLDPGTGSMLLQVIVGGVMASLFVVRQRWTQLKGFFKRRRQGVEDPRSSGSGRDAD